MNEPTDCPGCGSTRLTPPVHRPAQPPVLNYRFETAAASCALAPVDVTLRQCAACGLVFNTTFNPDAIPYDEHYENRQSASPAFQSHLRGRVRAVLRRLPTGRMGRVLEVGCGKGEFLERLADSGAVSGVGYDTSHDGSVDNRPGILEFHRRYVGPADIHEPFDAVVCRHVIEHVPGIGAFLADLAAIARAAGDPVVFIETPRWEWIVSGGCLWDVFHEHVNYFTQPTLAHLCHRSGLRPIHHVPVLDGQYQWLALRALATASPSPMDSGARHLHRRSRNPARPPGIPIGGRLDAFARRATHRMAAIRTRVDRVASGQPWAIWGAGAKGVTLAHLFPGHPPALVIDANPAKQGCFIPGTPIPVVGPADPRLTGIALVLVANPHYLAEIRSSLQARGQHPALVAA